MDHDMVVREQMTERYLLDELDPEARDEFEGHFFECQDCAMDVRAGAAFIDQSKIVLAEKSAEAKDAVTNELRRRRPTWFAWLSPSFAVPVMALLLAVVGYQNLVQYPQMAKLLNHPQVLAYASLNPESYGSESQVVAVRQGSGFGLLVRIPSDSRYAKYTADLINPAGRIELSLPIPAESVHDQRMLQVPARDWKAGTYTLKLHGVTAAGETKDVGQSTFDLQIQK